MLYWYPLDFTFVCPTEIKGFQSLTSDFGDESVAVIGVSTDSFYSHKNWFADRKTFPQDITHPVIADTNHAVSRAFGVLKEDQGVAFRATVIVDDKGIVRSVAVNDLSVGRSPKEVLRTVQALQSGGLCGADWQKGRLLRRVIHGTPRAIDGKNWREFTQAPLAVLMIGKSDCPACGAWTRGAGGIPRHRHRVDDVRFGKILLDEPGRVQAREPLARALDELPFNQLYAGGERSKSRGGRHRPAGAAPGERRRARGRIRRGRAEGCRRRRGARAHGHAQAARAAWAGAAAGSSASATARRRRDRLPQLAVARPGIADRRERGTVWIVNRPGDAARELFPGDRHRDARRSARAASTAR